MYRQKGVDYRLESVPREVLDSLSLQPGTADRTTKFLPVLALTITRSTPNQRDVLVCVRDPEANVAHPDVLSSPTMRLPANVDLTAVLDGWPAQETDWLPDAAAELLQKKLGVDYIAATSCPLGRVRVWQGESIIGIQLRDGSLVSEPLTMVNIHVEVAGRPILFPEQTTDYSAIGWIPEHVHCQLAQYRDASGTDLVTYLRAAHNPIVYGLCTKSTAEMLVATGGTKLTRLLRAHADVDHLSLSVPLKIQMRRRPL